MSTDKMPETPKENTYTFFMPQEERLFFRYFHVIAIGLLLVFISLGVFASESTVEDSALFAAAPVLAMYALRALFQKRLAQSVTLNFDTRTVRFVFFDERGTLEKNFQDIEIIIFRFYLTFVLKDARIMIKRPRNKKAAYQVLRSVSNVDVGIFKGF